MRVIKLILALPVLALMIGFAKFAQYNAVDMLGGELGFALSSLAGLIPVIAFYYWAAMKLPKLNIVGFSRG